MSKLLKG